MNELAITDERLNQMLTEVSERTKKLHTKEGQSAAMNEMTKLFAVLRNAGYYLPKDTDKQEMSRTWTAIMADYIGIYGFHTLREAVTYFIREDPREVRVFPTVADIIACMKEVGVNPKAEQAKREQAERERKMEEEHRRDYDTAMTPEHKAELWDKYGEKIKALFESNEFDDTDN